MTQKNPMIAYLDSGRVYIAKPGESPIEHESDFVRNLEDRRATEVQRKAWQQGSDSWNTSAKSGPLIDMAASNETAGNAVHFSSLQSSPNGFTYLVNAGTVCALLEYDPSDDTERRIKHDHSPFAAQISHAHDDRFIMSRRSEYGHSHIAFAQGSLNTASAITSGDVLDDAPSFHPTNSDVVVYHSAGVSRGDDGTQYCLGPTKIIKLELNEEHQTVCAENDELDYLAPRFLSDGSILCLERPWEPFRPLSTTQSIKETLMIPVALVRLFITLAHHISLLISNKPVMPRYMQEDFPSFRNNAFVLWNKAVRLNEKNKDRDSDHGIVSNKWKLVRINTDSDSAKPETVAEQVAAYDILKDDSIVYTNGRSVWHLKDGTKRQIAKGALIYGIAAIS